MSVTLRAVPTPYTLRGSLLVVQVLIVSQKDKAVSVSPGTVESYIQRQSRLAEKKRTPSTVGPGIEMLPRRKEVARTAGSATRKIPAAEVGVVVVKKTAAMSGEVAMPEAEEALMEAILCH